MKNKIEDLRNHLFATLEALQDQDNPMEIERAKAISDVAQTIINSAKVEIQFLGITGTGNGSDFFPHENRRPAIATRPIRIAATDKKEPGQC